MDLAGKRIGFAMTGSFCTYDKVMPVIEKLVKIGASVMPILSYNAANNDTRFIKATELKSFLETTTKNKVLESIVEVEPIGPKKLLDLVIIAPLHREFSCETCTWYNRYARAACGQNHILGTAGRCS